MSDKRLLFALGSPGAPRNVKWAESQTVQEWEISGAPDPAREAGARVRGEVPNLGGSRAEVIAAPPRDINDIARQNARLRSTIEALGELTAYTMGLSAGLGIALCALVGDEFAKARQIITKAILDEVDSLNAKADS